MNASFFLIPFLFSFFLHFSSFSQESPVSEMYDLINDMSSDEGSLWRFYRVSSSPEKRIRYQEFYEDYKSKLESIDFESLSVNGRVDYLLTERRIDDRLYRLQEESDEYGLIQDWVDYSEVIYSLEKKRRRGIQLDGMQASTDLTQVSSEIQKKIEKLKTDQPRFEKQVVRRAQDVIRGHQYALGSVYEFYKDYDPEFTWWTKVPIKETDSLLNIYHKQFSNYIDSTTLAPDDGSGIIGQPIGQRELVRLLEKEMIPYTPEELVDIAMKEFAWCDKELLKASREMGFGDNWKAAQEKVKQSFVPPGKQPEAMLDLYNQSIDFLKEHNLISIPPLAEETWRMTMIPPERQRISPFFLGGEVLQISYPTDEMTHEEKMMSMRGNNPHFSRSTVHHELIAGHHMQQFVNRRNKPYRNFRTPFWTEGWALYWELLLYDMDFPRSPEDRIGMLFWRMHRCARIIFSLNYHLGEWTPQQCIDYLVDRVGHERANAEGEVRRSFTGNYGPLYQIAYMVGGLQFWDLKRELVDSGKMTFKEFHDAVMEENSMPVEMLRAILHDKKVKKDFTTSWRFYNK